MYYNSVYGASLGLRYNIMFCVCVRAMYALCIALLWSRCIKPTVYVVQIVWSVRVSPGRSSSFSVCERVTSLVFGRGWKYMKHGVDRSKIKSTAELISIRTHRGIIWLLSLRLDLKLFESISNFRRRNNKNVFYLSRRRYVTLYTYNILQYSMGVYTLTAVKVYSCLNILILP